MIKSLFKGRYFDSDLVDETLEVIPLDNVKGCLVFSKSEAMDMKNELDKILEKAEIEYTKVKNLNDNSNKRGVVNGIKFVTHNEKKRINIAGTSLVGEIDISYAELVEIFGEPSESGYDDYKCDAHWDIEFDSGVVSTIYNWKDGKNYNGESGLDTVDITDWHVGGAGSLSLGHVARAITEYRDQNKKGKKSDKFVKSFSK